VVADNPDITSFAINPFEDHSPLIVDADRVKIFQVSLQLLQPVWGRHFQVFQPARRVNRFELALCWPDIVTSHH
jgi:hypothetical protein